MSKFKQEVLEKMKTDPDLFAALCKATNVKPTALTQTINRNGNAINQYHIVALVAAHLKKKPEDLLEKPSKVKGALK